jgi:hypothetical protein
MNQTGNVRKTAWHYCDWLFARYAYIGSVGGALAVLSVLRSAWSSEATRKWLVTFWSTAPAIWVFCEFHWARATKVPEEDIKRIKESQELAGKVWAAVVTALSVLYVKGGN